MSTEQPVLSGTPSQVISLPVFVLLGPFFWLVIPIFMMLWKWLVVKNTRYELTTERLKMRHGVLSEQTNELELYRVRDYRLELVVVEDRLAGLSSCSLRTSRTRSSRFAPSATARNCGSTSASTSRLRETKGVREIDFE